MSYFDLITREQNPPNFEYPFSALNGFTTPSNRHYVRCHFPVPRIEPVEYRLSIEGNVARPFSLSLDDLRSMPQTTRPVTLECAGNGRVFLVPQRPGTQWGLGAVGTAEWTGVRLGEILNRAQIRPSAVEVIFEGADQGKPKAQPTPPRAIHYAHSVPVSKVVDVLVAIAMNGRPIPPAHGFPARIVVPGWYGMASVKWVRRIIVSDVHFRGYFRTVDYARWEMVAGNPVRVPIEQMSVKAQIARPAMREVVAAKTDYLVTGAAWAGDAAVARVEVTADGGSTFADAELLGDPVRHAWRRWQYRWRAPAAGEYGLRARATDERGSIQPEQHDESNGSYLIDHQFVTPITVE